jgi:hypothetical protein
MDGGFGERRRLDRGKEIDTTPQAQMLPLRDYASLSHISGL